MRAGIEHIGQRRDGSPDRPACARQEVSRRRIAQLGRETDVGDAHGLAGRMGSARRALRPSLPPHGGLAKQRSGSATVSRQPTLPQRHTMPVPSAAGTWPSWPAMPSAPRWSRPPETRPALISRRDR